MVPKPKSRKAANNMKKEWKRLKRLNAAQSYAEFAARQEEDREIQLQLQRDKEAAVSADEEAAVAKFKIEQAQAEARRIKAIGSSNSISMESPWDMKSVKDFKEVRNLEIGQGQAQARPIKSIRKKSPSNVFEPAKSSLDSLGDMYQEDEDNKEDPSKMPDLKK